MRWLLLVTPLLALGVSAQQRVLHFTKTSGFDHNTRTASFAMFQAIALELAIEVDDDASGGSFSDPSVLAQYTVIVFANTTGNALLNAQQQANFEQWVANGGHVLGIHAATDTYRHSTANGNNTGSWDFYPELIGASVQENPNHVSGTPQYAMTHIGMHPSTESLPDPWVKNEEYYYWEGGYYGPDNTEVLRVEETVGPNGQVNSYDAARPISWHRELPNGSRVFYTALGHATDNYTSDALFRMHIKDGLVWLLDTETGIVEEHSASIWVAPIPARDAINIISAKPGSHLTLLDPSGRVVRSGRAQDALTTINVRDLPAGLYTLRVGAKAKPVMVLH